MKLPFACVLPVFFALLLPSVALAQAPADAAPLGATAASHADHKGSASARGHARTTKKPKAKAKSKRARTPGKAPKAKPGKKSSPKG